MNTKIGTTFGLALLMAIAAIATMFALGMFSASGVSASAAAEVHGVSFTPSSTNVNAKASWEVTFGVSGSGALAKGSATITITFPSGVVLPATIDKSRISVGGGGTGSDVGLATFLLDPLTSDPTVSGQTVTLTVPATNAAGDPVSESIENDNVVKIFFSQLAGILNPAASGNAGKIDDGNAGKLSTSSQTSTSNALSEVSFKTTISVNKTSAAEGDTVVVTLGGFTSGLKVSLTGTSVTGSATVGSDGKAVINGTMKGVDTNKVGAKDTAVPNIEILEADGKKVTLTPTLTATASGQVGDTITLTGKNFKEGSFLTGASAIDFGGTPLSGNSNTSEFGTAGTTNLSHLDKDADTQLDDFSIKFTIPSDQADGVIQVKVTDDFGSNAKATVTVEKQSITLTPNSGPPGTSVIVTGSGFPKNDPADSINNKITMTPDFNTAGVITPNTNNVTGLFTDGSGALSGSDTITIPPTAATAVISIPVFI
ncbi:MAG: hypothetical protein IIB32_02895, partial [Chloroflexi bacterium]|nr:hypothetical protein [Chloroflexota bacterium]